MKIASILLLTGIAALAGCSTTANNGNSNANMRGTNTNTGYVTNSDTNVKPAMPTNVTNISPPGGSTTNANTSNANVVRNSNTNTNANRKPN